MVSGTGVGVRHHNKGTTINNWELTPRGLVCFFVLWSFFVDFTIKKVEKVYCNFGYCP